METMNMNNMKWMLMVAVAGLIALPLAGAVADSR